jgi:hypothetical protein
MSKGRNKNMNTELWNKISPLSNLNVKRIVVEKSYQYYCFERNEKLQAYKVIVNLNDTTNAVIIVMVGNEVYVDEVICHIVCNMEQIYSGNISLDEVVEKLQNIDELEAPFVESENKQLTDELVK